MTDDEVDFRELLERYAADPHVTLIMLTLLSGDKYFVIDRDELVLGKRVVSMLARNGESFFPFEAICNVDVRHK